MAHTFAHNTPEKEPDVWGMKKKKSPFGIEQSGGITTETFGSKGPNPKYNKYFPNNQSQKVNTMANKPYIMSGEDAQKNYFTAPSQRKDIRFSSNLDTENKIDWRKYAAMVNNQDYQDDNYFGNFGGIHYGNPEFEWGMNMPTFNLVKGGLDTLGGLTNTWMNFKKFGLLEDQAKYEMDMGDKRYANDLILGNNQIADANFGIRERNLFKEKTMKPGGYILQDELKTLPT